MTIKTYFTASLLAMAMTVALPDAYADPVPIAGAALGAGVGAVAGHSISGRDGALVGGALGAVAGYQVGKHYSRNHRRVSSRPVYHSTRPVRYASRPVARHIYGRGPYYRDQYGRLVRLSRPR